MKQNTDAEKANDFASYFENSLVRMDKLKPGQMLETQIVSIGKDCAFLQLSGKSEGVLDRAEITDKDGKLTAEEGDTIKVFFLQAKNGEMLFTTRISGDKAGQAMLENAYKNKIPVEGVVEKEIKGGYEVKIGESRAFCPYSQMGLKRTEDAASWVGKHLTFKIQEYKDGGRNLLVSNRVIEEEARQGQLEELKKALHEGMVIKGTIKSVQDFGAFVDIGGVQGLLPVSEIARTRVADIRTVLSDGQEVETEIIKIDWKNERITLSLKSLLADPWDGVADKYPKNSKHKGTVSRLAAFGAFVTLESGIDGLVHISEMRGSDKYNNASESLKVGQSLTVQVIGVDVENRRISLKPTSSLEEDETSRKYFESEAAGDTYNPFAELLKKKK
jgi:small subunit ribosomal protein S1